MCHFLPFILYCFLVLPHPLGWVTSHFHEDLIFFWPTLTWWLSYFVFFSFFCIQAGLIYQRREVLSVWPWFHVR
jgi:hypothetical protein